MGSACLCAPGSACGVAVASILWLAAHAAPHPLQLHIFPISHTLAHPAPIVSNYLGHAVCGRPDSGGILPMNSGYMVDPGAHHANNLPVWLSENCLAAFQRTQRSAGRRLFGWAARFLPRGSGGPSQARRAPFGALIVWAGRGGCVIVGEEATQRWGNRTWQHNCHHARATPSKKWSLSRATHAPSPRDCPVPPGRRQLGWAARVLPSAGARSIRGTPRGHPAPARPGWPGLPGRQGQPGRPGPDG
eukprot:gene23085-biopygen10317